MISRAKYKMNSAIWRIRNILKQKVKARWEVFSVMQEWNIIPFSKQRSNKLRSAKCKLSLAVRQAWLWAWSISNLPMMPPFWAPPRLPLHKSSRFIPLNSGLQLTSGMPDLISTWSLNSTPRTAHLLEMWWHLSDSHDTCKILSGGSFCFRVSAF